VGKMNLSPIIKQDQPNPNNRTGQNMEGKGHSEKKWGLELLDNVPEQVTPNGVCMHASGSGHLACQRR